MRGWKRVPAAYGGNPVYLHTSGDVAQEDLQLGKLRGVPEEFAEFVRRTFGEEDDR